MEGDKRRIAAKMIMEMPAEACTVKSAKRLQCGDATNGSLGFKCQKWQDGQLSVITTRSLLLAVLNNSSFAASAT